MGVQAVRLVSPLARKDEIVITAPASAAAVAPAANSITIVSMLAAEDAHRSSDVQRRVRECLNRLRQITFNEASAADVIAVIPIGGGKGNITIVADMTTVITGTVAVGIDAALITGGAKNWIEEAVQQTLDWMGEQGRLGV
jgi:hypothetical protein